MKQIKIWILTLFLLILFSNTVAQSPENPTSNDVTVMVLLGEWFGDTYFILKEHLDLIGWKMVRVGVDAEYRGCYNKARDVVLKTDAFINDIKDFSEYDCLIIPSGPQWQKFSANKDVLKFINNVHDKGVLIASFCTGNLVVQASGLTDLQRKTGLFPEKVIKIKEGVLLGPRGGGPPPGDGYKSAPINDVCKAIAEELNIEIKE